MQDYVLYPVTYARSISVGLIRMQVCLSVSDDKDYVRYALCVMRYALCVMCYVGELILHGRCVMSYALCVMWGSLFYMVDAL